MFLTQTETLLQNKVRELSIENAALKAQLAAAQKDAERYRLFRSHWTSADIRNNRDGSFKSMTVTIKSASVCDELNAEKLDAAIDAAIAKEKDRG